MQNVIRGFLCVSQSWFQCPHPGAPLAGLSGAAGLVTQALLSGPPVAHPPLAASQRYDSVPHLTLGDKFPLDRGLHLSWPLPFSLPPTAC